jgi:hypothetical protein
MIGWRTKGGELGGLRERLPDVEIQDNPYSYFNASTGTILAALRAG